MKWSKFLFLRNIFLEVAFIRNIDRIWMSAQPTLSTARDQAIKYGYPSWSVLTSTPNGTAGIGEFFYSYWQNAVDSDELFEIDESSTEENQTNNNYIYEKFKKDSDDIINAPGKNGFARVYFHWSEDRVPLLNKSDFLR